jgi:hypothetical protein
LVDVRDHELADALIERMVGAVHSSSSGLV